jgi:hypothetical protein
MKARACFLALLAILVPACGGDSDDAAPAPAPTTQPVASGTVTAASGGTVSAPAGSANEGTEVDIPAGALAADTTVTIAQVVGDSPYPSNVLTYVFGPEGTTFSAPVTITLKVDPAYLLASGLALTDLRVSHRSGTNPPEILTPTATDAVASTVTVQTDHFSTFAAVGYSDELMKGTYYVISHFYDPGESQGLMPTVGTELPAPAGFGDRFGLVTFDGAGAVAVSMNERRDGLVTSDSSPDVYSVSSTGALSLGGTVGAVHQDGTLFVAAGQPADPEKELVVGIRREGTFSNASLSGAYHLVSLEMDQSITQPNAPSVGTPLPLVYGFGSSFGEAVFDGLGGGTLTGSFKEGNGTVTPDSGAFTYSVQSNGALSIDASSGQILMGGRLVILNTTSTSEPSQITLLVKKGPSTGQSNADLNGSYFLIQMYMVDGAVQPNAPAVGALLPSRSGFGTLWGTLTLAGDGTGSFSGTSNFNGSITASSDPAVTYSVAANGAVGFSGGRSGFVGEGGTLILLANPTAGQEVVLSLLLKR